MVDETIVNEIQLTGAEQVKKEFDDVGAAGEASLNRISTAIDQMPDIGRTATAAFAGIGQSVKAVGDASLAFTGLGTSVKNTRASLAQFLPQAAQTRSAMQTIRAAFAGLFSSIDSTTQSTTEASAAMKQARGEATEFSSALRLLGRVAGVPGLRESGFAIRELGRSASIVGPLITAGIVFGMERLAVAATNAAGAAGDLAATLRISISELAAAAAAGSAAGIAQSNFGKSLTGVSTLIKDTADKDAALATSTASLSDQLDASRNSSIAAAAGYTKIRNETTSLAFGLALGRTTLAQFTDGQARARESANQISLQLDKEDANFRKIERSMQLANIAAIQNGTALQKLGIQATDSLGHLKTAPGVLLEIADALKAMPAGFEKTQVEFDLVAAGLDRRLLPALRQGSAAFKDIQAKAAVITPGFTQAQLDIADKFAVATELAASAWSAFTQALGLAIAPNLIPFFDQLTQVLVNIRQPMADFAAALSAVIGPALVGIVSAISAAVIPVFGAFQVALQTIADLVNNIFGTNISAVNVFVGAIAALAIAFGGIPIAITAIVAVLGQAVTLLQSFGVSGQVAGIIITTVLAGLAILFGGIPLLIAGIVVAFGLLVKAWNDGGLVVDFLKQKWADFTTSILGFIDSIKSAWNALVSFVNANNPFGSAQSATVAQGQAAGGPIFGPGGPTSDSVPIWASAGEFMVQARAVRKYGVAFMHAINQMRINPSDMMMALGGPVMPPHPTLKFAQGGVIPSAKNVLNLTIGTEQFQGLQVEDKTMDKLTRFAVRQQVRSGGRKPAWHK